MAHNGRQLEPQRGSGGGPVRAAGLIHMVFGAVFVVMGLASLPAAGLSALLFILAGGFFAVNGGRIAFGKNGKNGEKPAPGRRDHAGGPDGPAGGPSRTLGMFFFVFGLVFALMGLTLLDTLGLFGLPFLLAGAAFAVSGGKMAFRFSDAKKEDGAPRRTSAPKFDPDARDHEHIRSAPIARSGEVFQVPVSPRFRPEARDHEHIVTSPDHSVERQLEQLETMRGAGLIDAAEYRERKRRITEGR